MNSTVPAPYLKDPSTGAWYLPTVSNQNLWANTQTVVPGEAEATKSLAKALYVNWLKSKKGKVLDLGAQNDLLIKALEALGCEAETGKAETAECDLVTLVHSFQKLSLHEAATLLQTVHSILKKDGTLFIRIPDHGVAGYERDLVPEVIDNTKCFWDLHAFLELLYQNPYFTIVETYPILPGSRDYLLKPIAKRPTVCIGMIAKNEERDIPRCLKSLRGVADGICFVDTGSTDKTMEIVKAWAEEEGFAEKNIHVTQYLGASEKDETGNWKLWNFSKARNQYVDWIESKKFDYVLWMDADDEVLDPQKLKNLRMWAQHKIHGIQIQDGTLRWPHHRLWRTGHGIRYTGYCHEYPSFSVADNIHQDVTIRHDSAPGAGESSNARNLRILAREMEEAPSTRCAFYLANTYKDARKYKEAVPVYQKRLDLGFGYVDEYYFAMLYKARCERHSGDLAAAYNTLIKATTERPAWAEFWMELAYLEYDRKDYNKAIGFSMLAKDRPIVPTALFREPDKYKDQPPRLISWCFEHLGMLHAAYEMGIDAQKKIGSQDKDWEDRLYRLDQARDKTSRPNPKRKIAVMHRPGAIGDIIITLNTVKPFLEANPDTDLYYKCAPSIKPLLEGLIKEVGVTKVIGTDEANPANARMINLVGYPLKEGYPHRPMKDHLLEYFSREMGVEPNPNALVIPRKLKPKDLPKNYITLHAKAGWSPYKNWPTDRWEQIVKRLDDVCIPVVQIGGPDDPLIKGTIDYRCSGLEKALLAQSHAVCHMGIDSWTNHATNIQWAGRSGSGKRDRVPAVILWGSTQYTAAGYDHNKNISLGLSCQPCFKEDPKISAAALGPCQNPPEQTYEDPKHACMAGIGIEVVYAAVLELWKENLT